MTTEEISAPADTTPTLTPADVQARTVRLLKALGWKWYKSQREENKFYFLAEKQGKDAVAWGKLECEMPDFGLFPKAAEYIPDLAKDTPMGAYWREKLRQMLIRSDLVLNCLSGGFWDGYEVGDGNQIYFCHVLKASGERWPDYWGTGQATSDIEAFLRAADSAIQALDAANREAGTGKQEC